MLRAFFQPALDIAVLIAPDEDDFAGFFLPAVYGGHVFPFPGDALPKDPAHSRRSILLPMPYRLSPPVRFL